MAAVLPQIAPPRKLFLSSRYGREFDLLLACCRGEEGQSGDVHWPCLAELAQDHGVVLRLYEELRGRIADDDLLPLRKMYNASLRKSLLLTRELLRICYQLNNRGI